MKQLISNEQIINILKTWAVDAAAIQDSRFVTVWFINSTGEYKAMAMVDSNDSPQKYRVFSIQRKTDGHYETLYTIDSTFPDITIDFDYLVNIKATEHVKKKIDEMLYVGPLNGFDALVE